MQICDCSFLSIPKLLSGIKISLFWENEKSRDDATLVQCARNFLGAITSKRVKCTENAAESRGRIKLVLAPVLVSGILAALIKKWNQLL